MTLAEDLAAGVMFDEKIVVDIDDWRYTVEALPDDITSINDFDCYGKIEWVDGRQEFQQRPDGFTGAARKLWVNRGDCVWWEPFRDGHKVYDDTKTRRHVIDLLEYGFYGLVLTIERAVPYAEWPPPMSRPAKTITLYEPWSDAAVFGIDDRSRETLEYIINDLIAEASARAEQGAA